MRISVYRFDGNRPVFMAHATVKDAAEALRVREAWMRDDPDGREYNVYERSDNPGRPRLILPADAE